MTLEWGGLCVFSVQSAGYFYTAEVAVVTCNLHASLSVRLEHASTTGAVYIED